MDRYCFFKIMFGNDHAKVMYLPPAFARKVMHLIDQEAEIEDKSGCRWSVTVSRVNGSLAFKRGWEQFFLDHGLTVGKLLVFTYMEGRHFSVQIFTKSGLERTNFGNEMPRQRKRHRRVQGAYLEDEPYQTADVDKTIPNNSLNSVDFTISANLDSPGNEFQRCKSNFEVVNADFAVSEPTPMPVNIEDPICTINREVVNADFAVSQPTPMPVNIEDPICTINRDSCYEDEHRNLLFDLSSFEIEIKQVQKALIGVSDPPLTETAQHVVNSEDASGANISLTGVGIVESTKPAGDNAMEHATTAMKDAGIQDGNDQVPDSCRVSPSIGSGKIAGREYVAKIKFGELSVSSSAVKQPLGTGGHPFIESGKIAGREDPAKIKFGELSLSSSAVKHPLGTGGHPFIRSGKIAGREDAAKIKFGELSPSSSAVKHPLGTGGHPIIKKELVDMEEKASAFNDVSYRGKVPIVASYMNSPPVKVKPEPAPESYQSLETGPSDSISSFTAQVQSQLYLELPDPIITSARGKKMNVQKMVVFLRGSTQKIWPVFCYEYCGVNAFTINWTKFCEHNNIKPGDRCVFLPNEHEGDPKSLVYRVEVTRGSD